jgi:hypothetical protein
MDSVQTLNCDVTTMAELLVYLDTHLKTREMPVEISGYKCESSHLLDAVCTRNPYVYPLHHGTWESLRNYGVIKYETVEFFCKDRDCTTD